ncbi:MAG TPA: PEGA domain-containing protein [Candidatus Saccharimonadales bacterium]|nr:PEGA domain-containing protein [Candidatus Saccharimonadales bacterium]
MHKRTDVSTTQGTVSITYNPSPISELSIAFDGTERDPATSPASYKLSTGNHKLVMSAPGYETFSVTVHVTAQQTVTVNAQLHLKNTAPVTSSDQIILPDTIHGAQILDTQYFYNKSWAIVRANTTEDTNLILILQFDTSSNKWITAIDPATIFEGSAIANLPALIQQYLNDHDLVINGD